MARDEDIGNLYIIGNGFDLNLGMKTRYTDMYDSYINSESSNEIIAQFKKGRTQSL